MERKIHIDKVVTADVFCLCGACSNVPKMRGCNVTDRKHDGVMIRQIDGVIMNLARRERHHLLPLLEPDVCLVVKGRRDSDAHCYLDLQCWHVKFGGGWTRS